MSRRWIEPTSRRRLSGSIQGVGRETDNRTHSLPCGHLSSVSRRSRLSGLRMSVESSFQTGSE